MTVMTFGICMTGVEEKFELALRERATRGQPFVYLEIGTALFGTFKSACTILESTGADWKAIGIDPSKESREAFESLRAGSLAASQRVTFISGTREEAFREHGDKIGDKLHFVFIDGCHSEGCATGDFLAVEPLVQSGGLVVLHDHWPGPSGLQPHCRAELGVIPAVQKLGLFDNSRTGWWRLPDWETTVPNNWPCGCYEKV